jgi:hypothetical protein
MRGGEQAVSSITQSFMALAAVDNLRVSMGLRSTMLLVFAFGVDRFFGVSDASSLRAVAELTRMGGFLGSSSIEQSSEGFRVYSDFMLYCATKYKTARQSLVAGMVAAATVGQYGPYQTDIIPKYIPRNFARSGVPRSAIEYFGLMPDGGMSASLNNQRVKNKDAYIWPLMAQVFGFDIETVMERNLIAPKCKGIKHWGMVGPLFEREMQRLDRGRLMRENIPLAEQMAKR